MLELGNIFTDGTMPADAALPGTGKRGPGHFFFFFFFFNFFFFCGRIFGYEKLYPSSCQPCGYSSIRLPVAALMYTRCMYIIIIFGSCIAHIITLYNVYMRFQRALEIITLALAPAAVISAQCISRNNPIYLTWVECGKYRLICLWFLCGVLQTHLPIPLFYYY